MCMGGCGGKTPSIGGSRTGYTPKKQAVQTSPRGINRGGSTSNLLYNQYGTPKVRATFSSRGKK